MAWTVESGRRCRKRLALCSQHRLTIECRGQLERERLKTMEAARTASHGCEPSDVREHYWTSAWDASRRTPLLDKPGSATP